MELEIVRRDSVLTNVGRGRVDEREGNSCWGMHLARAARVYADPMAVGARSAEVALPFRRVAKWHR